TTYLPVVLVRNDGAFDGLTSDGCEVAPVTTAPRATPMADVIRPPAWIERSMGSLACDVHVTTYSFWIQLPNVVTESGIDCGLLAARIWPPVAAAIEFSFEPSLPLVVTPKNTAFESRTAPLA